jgi:hypothetical protein
MICCRVETNVNPGIITRLLLNHYSPLAMKDEDRLKGGVNVGHDVEYYSGLPLVPATAVRFAGHGGHPLPVIGVAARNSKGRGVSSTLRINLGG